MRNEAFWRNRPLAEFWLRMIWLLLTPPGDPDGIYEQRLKEMVTALKRLILTYKGSCVKFAREVGVSTEEFVDTALTNLTMRTLRQDFFPICRSFVYLQLLALKTEYERENSRWQFAQFIDGMAGAWRVEGDESEEDEFTIFDAMESLDCFSSEELIAIALYCAGYDYEEILRRLVQQFNAGKYTDIDKLKQFLEVEALERIVVVAQRMAENRRQLDIAVEQRTLEILHRFLAGETNGDISQAMGITEVQVSQALNRAARWLAGQNPVGPFREFLDLYNKAQRRSPRRNAERTVPPQNDELPKLMADELARWLASHIPKGHWIQDLVRKLWKCADDNGVVELARGLEPKFDAKTGEDETLEQIVTVLKVLVTICLVRLKPYRESLMSLSSTQKTKLK